MRDKSLLFGLFLANFSFTRIEYLYCIDYSIMSYLLKIALYIRIICPSIGGFRVFEYPLFGEYCFVFLLPRRLKMTQLISKVNR